MKPRRNPADISDISRHHEDIVVKAVILGAGGHAKVIIDILRENNGVDLQGSVSREPVGYRVSGVPVIGGEDALPRLLADGVGHIFVALGDNALRARMIEHVRSLGFTLLRAVSRHAILSPSAVVGEGAAVMPGVVINADTTIGDGAIVNTGATVDHDCTIGPMSHIGPGSNLAGGVQVGTGTFLGTGSRVIPRIRIGEWSVMGAGAVVVKDMPDKVVAAGVPARILRRL